MSDLPGCRVGPRQRLGTFAVNEFKLFSAIGRKATARRSRCRTKANGPQVPEQRNDGAALWFRRAKDDVTLSTHGRARASFQRPSDLSLTPRYLHDARSDDNRQLWSRASPLGTRSISRLDCIFELTRWIREISIYSVCRSDYCEQPRAMTSATPSTTSPRTSQMRSYLSTVGSQCGGTRRSRSPR